MFGIGIQELGLIFVVALLVFGPKRLPELARTLGRGLGEFRRASNELRQSLALDELQDDLRRDLGSAGSILKPAPPPDRPAQAGDDLPTSTPKSTPKSTPQTKPQTKASTPSDAQPVEGESAPPSQSHPGELPPGDDHEHHDEDPGVDGSEPRGRRGG